MTADLRTAKPSEFLDWHALTGLPVKRAFLTWPLRAAISACLILLLARTLDFETLVSSVLAADKSLVLAAFMAAALTPVLAAERWRHCGRALHFDLSRRTFLRSTYAANFAGQFLPAGIGVDSARVALLWQQRVPMPVAVLSIVIDRVTGMTALLILMIAGIPFVPVRMPHSVQLALGGGVGMVIVGVLVLLFIDRFSWGRMREIGWVDTGLKWLRQTLAALETANSLAALIYGLALHMLSILAIFLLARALGQPLHFWELLSVTSLAIFVALLPISFNGWGVREGALILGLSLLSVTRETALLISLLYGFIMAVGSLPGSVLWHPARSRANP